MQVMLAEVQFSNYIFTIRIRGFSSRSRGSVAVIPNQLSSSFQLFHKLFHKMMICSLVLHGVRALRK